MIPLTEAQEFVLQSISTTDATEIPIDESMGISLSETLFADESIPPCDNTAVDGFAITEEDRLALEAGNELRLKISITIPAGSKIELSLAAGEAARIMTGANIPVGTSCVVMVEDSVVVEDSVIISKKPKPGENIRRAGTDIAKGDELFQANTTLGAPHIGVLASVGYARVPGYRRPRIGVISTGNELTDRATTLERGQIRDSNRHSLLAIIATTGAEVVDLGIIADDSQLLKNAFNSAATNLDAIVTSGGVSVGDFDYTKAVLAELSENSAKWMQIAIRPAKPFAFGYIRNVPFFALPGNPVSALVSFELLVRPAIRKMMGMTDLFNQTIKVEAANSYRRVRDSKTHFVRANLSRNEHGEIMAESLDKQSSHMLHEMSRSNALAIVPDGLGFAKGDLVEVMPLPAARLFT